MNIDEMPAGREMDALVAEKVMGWANIRGAVVEQNTNIVRDVPSYSTDIAAAWDVVEKINTKKCFIELKSTFPTWFAGIFKGFGHNYEIIECANEKTAPLAICRAALKAVSK